METKNKILQVALELFSKKGYEAVSVRDIASVVGVRESALYKHYANKRAILDVIVEQASKRMEEFFTSLERRFMEVDEWGDSVFNLHMSDFQSVCTEIYFFLQKEELVASFGRILALEQYQDEKLGKMYRELWIDRPTQFFAKAFSYMMEQEELLRRDSYVMAFEFYSPIFMLQQRYDRPEKALPILMTHVRDFIEDYGK